MWAHIPLVEINNSTQRPKLKKNQFLRLFDIDFMIYNEVSSQHANLDEKLRELDASVRKRSRYRAIFIKGSCDAELFILESSQNGSSWTFQTGKNSWNCIQNDWEAFGLRVWESRIGRISIIIAWLREMLGIKSKNLQSFIPEQIGRLWSIAQCDSKLFTKARKKKVLAFRIAFTFPQIILKTYETISTTNLSLCKPGIHIEGRWKNPCELQYDMF